MKVRKPQSKRKSTRLQKGIEKKISAHNRKQKKLSKKDPTWKSRHPKDPGIPNSFPYKAQLLEEIESKKQADIEARELRREQMRAAAIAQGASAEQVQAMDAQQDIIEQQNRLGALMDSVNHAALEFAGEIENVDNEDEMADDSDDEVTEELENAFVELNQDASRKAFDKYFKQILDACDIIIYVLDARNPTGTRSKEVEKLVLQNPNKRLVFALNKIDLVPTEVLSEWIKHLNKQFPTVPINASGAAPNAFVYDHPYTLSKQMTAQNMLKSLKKWSGQANLGRAAVAGVIGYPNVGKSSVINALLGRHGGGKACPVGAQAGVTTDIRRVKIDSKLSILDSPGIVFPNGSKNKNPVEEQARLILLNVMQPRYIDDCRPAASVLVKKLQKNDDLYKQFMLHYNIPPVVQIEFEEFMTQLLVHIGRKMGRLNKGGVADLQGAAQSLVTDYTSGRIPGWEKAPDIAKVAKSQVEVVSSWSKEFDLDGILEGLL
ncbi:RNA-binding GTPase [Starmerella bacillaris]|uniref:RNA-binding GTPase n=1 Tax=Starmerella bacillaris TaxID=1247836 RepID=A0AAV5RGJ0_STABA|nr:RNA-binding GTPase [Starmerella bacillaris]